MIDMTKASNAESQGRVIGIVSSAGGPQALLEILKILPSIAVPIVIVQHITPGFSVSFVEWLNQKSNHEIKLAENDEELKPRTVYIAPAELHMRVNFSGRIELREDPPINGSRPSGTVLLESIAIAFGKRGLGILLTGMGNDGAKGLKAMKDAGAHTIVQDEKSSVAFGMPKAAIDMEAADVILPLSEIAEHIAKWIMGR